MNVCRCSGVTNFDFSPNKKLPFFATTHTRAPMYTILEKPQRRSNAKFQSRKHAIRYLYVFQANFRLINFLLELLLVIVSYGIECREFSQTKNKVKIVIGRPQNYVHLVLLSFIQ